MKRDLRRTTPLTSSFLSCEKDTETILKKLFVESRPYSDELKRLLVINTKDCLDDTTNPTYIEKIQSMSVAKLREEGYIKLEPKIKFPEHEEIKAYMIVSFDIICHTDFWDIGNYRLRPVKIVGYIDGILNESRLSGIGTLNFLGCNQLILDENLSGYSLSYRAIHGSDDQIPGVE